MLSSPRSLRALSALTVLAITSCHPVPGPDKTFTGAVLGAGWGAGAGSVIGHQTGNAIPGMWVGMGFGALSGALTGVGLDITEGTELEQQRQIDALKVQVAANHRNLAMMQDSLDDRDRRLVQFSGGSEQVFFDSGRASIRLGTASKLERVADAIKQNPYVGMIELHGHTDDAGDTETNQKLSEARARTVATFLSSHGIPLNQLRIVSHGAEQPLGSNETEAGRQLNRRVEIVLRK